MAITQTRPKRKLSGSRYKDYRKKKQYELGRNPSFTKVAEKKLEKNRIMGGHLKVRALSQNVANLYDPKTKNYSKVPIKGIKENSANRNFVRRNIINKGAVIETEKGDAKVTSRPGQEGVVNAVLISK
jgi:small subunit ribosomal protein S8e|tara:strand:+ start:57356 stop:57739 length:384 start_codon:yes stop_codon:yes gene_type:complete